MRIKPPQGALVNADEELASFLQQAGKHIDRNEYRQAIDILHALITRPNSGFIPAGEKGRYVSLRHKAVDLIGQLPPEGLKLYRTLYDAQARRLMEDALAEGDTIALRRVVERYLYTRVGAEALETLAALQFDRGRFSQAAQTWQQRLELPIADADRPMLLAKLAAAWHLAGESHQSQRVARRLADRHPDADTRLGRRRRNLVAFVKEVRSLAPPAEGGRRRVEGDWPGLGGVSDGLAIMEACDVVLMPRWRRPDVPYPSGVLNSLIAQQSLLAERGRVSSRTFQVEARLRRGVVEVSSSYGNDREEFILPPTIHPVVAGDLIIYRTDEGVVARDAFTGHLAWESFHLPLERDVNYTGRTMERYIGDAGRYALTVGGGNVYALAEFRPPGSGATGHPGMRRNQVRPAADTSVLVALSLAWEGYEAWRVGGPGTDDEVLSSCRFLTAPTYHAGRLYTLVTHLERYYVVCLRAEDGSLVWRSEVAQVPASSPRPGQSLPNHVLSMGSPPAVADGRVFALTNAGVIASVDAETGQVIWAREYASRIPEIKTGHGVKSLYPPSNPLIVTRGKVICLPSDSATVVALRVDDGRIAWSRSRKNQRVLSPVDSGRVLLAGPSLAMLASGDGKVLLPPPPVEDINGRPAVMADRVLASGAGRLYRLELGDLTLEQVPLESEDGLLGNLVCASGKLLAANAMGVCAYFPYELAYDGLADRIEAAEPRDRLDLLFRRGRLSFNVRRPARALADFLACRRLAEQLGESMLAARLTNWVYLCHVAKGNLADSDADRLEQFQKARQLAETDQQRGHMLLRLAKHYERAGELDRSVELAQQLSEQFAGEKLVDVRIGSEADVVAHFGPEREVVPGRQLGQRHIQRLIEIHGRSVYDAFDRRAAQAVAQAQADRDGAALEEVARRWPHSRWADDARFAAAELYYLRARRRGGKAAGELLDKTAGHLGKIANDPDSPLRVSAAVALANTYARKGSSAMVSIVLRNVQGLDPETPVKFADIEGTLGELLEQLRDGKLAEPLPAVEPASSIAPPLQEVYRLEGRDVALLRDQLFRPARMGEGVFVADGDRVVLLTGQADGADRAALWSAESAVDSELVEMYEYPVPGKRLVGGVTDDQQALLLCDLGSASAFDLETGRRMWHWPSGKLELSSPHAMALGPGEVIATDAGGAMVCVDASTGQVRWRTRLLGEKQYPVGPIRVTRRAVLVRHESFKAMTCLDCVTGKVLVNWQAKHHVDGRFAADGLMVTLIDGRLAVVDVGDPARPLWTRTYQAEHQPYILAVGADRVAVAPSIHSPRVEVLSLVGTGEPSASFSLAPMGGQDAVAIGGVFVDHRLIAVASVNFRKAGRQGDYGQLPLSRGLGVQCFDTDAPELRWSRTLEGDPEVLYSVLPATVGRRHVSLSAKRRDNASKETLTWLVSLADGQLAETLRVAPQSQESGELSRASRIGPPVMTTGHLFVETIEGLSVQSGQ